jgi:DNA-binding response OmpR family regulator
MIRPGLDSNAHDTVTKSRRYSTDLGTLRAARATHRANQDEPTDDGEVNDERVYPALPIITLGAGDELTALRAYEAGSDHHLPDTTGYVLLRTVLASVIRRAIEDVAATRHLRVGQIHIDVAARTVTVADSTVVCLSRLEFELLVKFASDPVRVFSKHELARCIWRCEISGRTVESHVCRLRTRLTAAGAETVLVNRWGQGWSLTAPSSQTGDSCLPVTG